jgi:hypothetical protein
VRIPELPLEVTGSALISVIDLGAAAEQWGSGAWTMIEDHFVRLVLDTLTPGGRLVVRLALNLDDHELIVVHQYRNLKKDFAEALYVAFADFDPAPAIVGRVDVQRGWYPLLAGVDGEAWFLVDSVEQPTLGVLHVEDDGLRWENRVFPSDRLRPVGEEQAPILPYKLWRPAVEGRSLTLTPELVVPLKLGAILEV